VPFRSYRIAAAVAQNIVCRESRKPLWIAFASIHMDDDPKGKRPTAACGIEGMRGQSFAAGIERRAHYFQSCWPVDEWAGAITAGTRAALYTAAFQSFAVLYREAVWYWALLLALNAFRRPSTDGMLLAFLRKDQNCF
jgi:hypothetical protein